MELGEDQDFDLNGLLGDDISAQTFGTQEAGGLSGAPSLRLGAVRIVQLGKFGDRATQ